MKKVEERYYCDSCGKECKHTPQYVFSRVIYSKIKDVQMDLCNECRDKVAYMTYPGIANYFKIITLNK